MNRQLKTLGVQQNPRGGCKRVGFALAIFFFVLIPCPALARYGAYAVKFSSTSVSFGSYTVGTQSAALNLVVTSSGSSTLAISSISLGGTNPGDFSQTNNCGKLLSAGATCTVQVAFKPTATGTRSARLYVYDNAARSPQSVLLSGTGIAGTPAVSIAPTTLTFASQTVGTLSTAQIVTVNNAGTAPLSVTSIVISGANASDFTQSSTCGTSLAQGANCTVSVAFNPSAVGTRSATLTIADNAASSPQGITLNGTGAGTPAASLAPASVSFGSQTVGIASASQSLTFTNTGTAALSITSVGTSGTNAADFTPSSNCGISLPAGTSCTISVTFKPSATGARSASVAVTDNAPGSPHVATLSGTGIGTPTVSLTPTSVSFGNQSVGVTSATQTVTLNNSGTASLAITSIAVSGTNASDFTQSNTCGASVAAGANCTITLTFKPAASGARSASLCLADNASGSPQAVSLSGTGLAPAATLSPSTLSFASQTLGSSSPAQTLSLSNSGNATLSISGISITGTNIADFSQSNTCGASVAAKASCSISVIFSPSASGPRSASLIVSDNASGGQQVTSLTGTGAGTPSVSVTPASLAFATTPLGTAAAAQMVTVSNIGTAALSISGITLTGTNSSDFSASNNCGSSIAAGSSCTITITFTPSVAGTRSASLAISDNASGSPQAITLSGTGVAAASASLSPANLTFASQPISTTSASQTIALTNTGISALTISGVAISGSNAADFAQNNNCGTSLTAGGSCTIVVLFTPSAAGTRSASLSVSDSAAGSPQSVGVSGVGGHDVLLSWTASSSSGVIGYNIYRGTTSGGEGSTPLNSSPINNTNFTDANVTAGLQYYYMVTSVMSNGSTQSSCSGEASATVPNN